MQEENARFDDARKDYQQAIAAEPKYIQPFERLSWLALRESKWQELVDRTDQWLRLDPLNSPDVYYLSSLGNLQTQHFDIAEKNAREAIRLDPGKKEHARALRTGPGPGAEAGFRGRRPNPSASTSPPPPRTPRKPKSSANSSPKSSGAAKQSDRLD